MADIRELVPTFPESPSHKALRCNRKRETLDACMASSSAGRHLLFPVRWSFLVPTSPDHSQSLVPKLLNEFCVVEVENLFDVGFEVIRC